MSCVSQDSEENRGWERCVAFSTLLSPRVKFCDITLDGEEEGDGDDGDGSGQDGPGDGAAPHHLVHLRRQELWQLDVSFELGDYHALISSIFIRKITVFSEMIRTFL